MMVVKKRRDSLKEYWENKYRDKISHAKRLRDFFMSRKFAKSQAIFYPYNKRIFRIYVELLIL